MRTLPSILVAALALFVPSAQAQTSADSTALFWEAAAEGLTMEEVARVRAPKVSTPTEALRLLLGGNRRFLSGTAVRPERDAFNRRAQIITQTPFAAVLGCADSRVPTEIVFDQNLGDLFTVRVAGNVVEPATAGSIEYAVEHLHTRLVVVMGHEGCGAVKAAMLPMAAQNAEPENVRYLLDRIRPHVAGVPHLRDAHSMTREAVVRNIEAQVREMRRNPVIAAAIRRGEIEVVGAYFEITSGAVDFLRVED